MLLVWLKINISFNQTVFELDYRSRLVGYPSSYKFIYAQNIPGQIVLTITL